MGLPRGGHLQGLRVHEPEGAGPGPRGALLVAPVRPGPHLCREGLGPDGVRQRPHILLRDPQDKQLAGAAGPAQRAEPLAAAVSKDIFKTASQWCLKFLFNKMT